MQLGNMGCVFSILSLLWTSVPLSLWIKISSFARSMCFTCFPWARTWVLDSDRALLHLWLLSGAHRGTLMLLKLRPGLRHFMAGRLTWTNVTDFLRDLILRFSLFVAEIATSRLVPCKFSEIWPMLWAGSVWLPCQGSQMKLLNGVPVDVAWWH